MFQIAVTPNSRHVGQNICPDYLQNDPIFSKFCIFANFPTDDPLTAIASLTVCTF
jgi:hypothetical protein